MENFKYTFNTNPLIFSQYLNIENFIFVLKYIQKYQFYTDDYDLDLEDLSAIFQPLLEDDDNIVQLTDNFFQITVHNGITEDVIDTIYYILDLFDWVLESDLIINNNSIKFKIKHK